MPEGQTIVGIKNIGIYLPRFRISGQVLSEAWRKPMGRGLKSVPNHDEDSLTMAVSAVVKAIEEPNLPVEVAIQPDKYDGLYFATTSAPYTEKSSASLIATAADMPTTIRTLDFSGSLRASTSALISGIESLTTNNLKNIIVAGADSRFAEPGSDLEPVIGAGAAALQISSEELENYLEVTDYISITDDLTDYWRKSEDRYIHHTDLKYAANYGATRTVTNAIKHFIEKTGRNLSEYTKVIISVPDPRSARGIAKILKLNPEQAQDNFIGQIGLVGNAQAFIMLADAAANCPEGSEILLANYGDGCDVLSFKKAGQFTPFTSKKGITEFFVDTTELPSYTKYLSYHNLIRDSTQNITSEPFSSTILAFREEKLNIRLHGNRCSNCWTVQTLDLKVCPHCKSREKYEDIKLSKRGRINTYTQEYYYPTPEPPVTMAVIDLEGGGRILAQMTDSDPSMVKIGMPVEMTFRKLHQGADFWNYCWKCRPIVTEEAGPGGDE